MEALRACVALSIVPLVTPHSSYYSSSSLFTPSWLPRFYWSLQLPLQQRWWMVYHCHHQCVSCQPRRPQLKLRVGRSWHSGGKIKIGCWFLLSFLWNWILFLKIYWIWCFVNAPNKIIFIPLSIQIIFTIIMRTILTHSSTRDTNSYWKS